MVRRACIPVSYTHLDVYKRQVGDHVGQDEGGVEGVGGNATAEEPHDVFDPHQRDDARQECGHHEHHGGRKNTVRMGGVKESQAARPPRTRARGGLG